jgi:hypothetical protein
MRMPGNQHLLDRVVAISRYRQSPVAETPAPDVEEEIRKALEAHELVTTTDGRKSGLIPIQVATAALRPILTRHRQSPVVWPAHSTFVKEVYGAIKNPNYPNEGPWAAGADWAYHYLRSTVGGLTPERRQKAFLTIKGLLSVVDPTVKIRASDILCALQREGFIAPDVEEEDEKKDK